jgi:hypothetical protein
VVPALFFFYFYLLFSPFSSLSLPPIMPEEFPPHLPGATFDKLENFNFLLSRTDPAAKAARQYSFDADTGLVPLANVNMDYDQTEGMGGLSVSSYDSIEDERGSLDLRGYPYHGTCIYLWIFFFSLFCSILIPQAFDLVREVASVAPSLGLVVRVPASGRAPLTAFLFDQPCCWQPPAAASWVLRA